MDISVFGKLIDNIKDSFSIGNKVVAGLDIGSNAVKVAILSKTRDKFKLINYARVPLSEGALIEDIIEKPDEIVSAIKQAVKKAKISTKTTCIGMFGPGFFVKILVLPEENIDDIEDQIAWDIEQYLPFTVEESFISHHVVKKSKQAGTTVLVAAAKQDVIFSFKDLVEDANLKVKIVDSQVTALTNIFEHVLKDKLVKANVSFLFMNIGAQKTEFIIYKDKSIVFTKEIPKI
ncbi:MAG: pilus assembly protein PilM, partial [Halobacteriovoraceae bacterium]|nr:pilus assembly protein PilM [Halobacteriovoraceae bacterium]